MYSWADLIFLLVHLSGNLFATGPASFFLFFLFLFLLFFLDVDSNHVGGSFNI